MSKLSPYHDKPRGGSSKASSSIDISVAGASPAGDTGFARTSIVER